MSREVVSMGLAPAWSAWPFGKLQGLAPGIQISPNQPRPCIMQSPTLLTSKPVAGGGSTDKGVERPELMEEGLLEDEDNSESDASDKPEYDMHAYIRPVALALSTVVGAVVMLFQILPLLFEKPLVPTLLFIALYIMTIYCMIFAAFADPGQSTEQPPRSHKSFQFPLNVRRYDHHCKWLANSIGLRNHREFVTLVTLLIVVAASGMAVDGVVAVRRFFEPGLVMAKIAISCHFMYSMCLMAIAWPIFVIHFQLISRNQLAQDWKHRHYYIANDTSRGDNVRAQDLSDDEFNALFDAEAFVYDSSSNPYDQGCQANCWRFWCEARWPADVKGDF